MAEVSSEDFDSRLAPDEDLPDDIDPGEVAPPREPSPEYLPWLELRRKLAKTDRLRWLQFFCSITSYRPFDWQLKAHLAGLTPDEGRGNKLTVCGIGSGKSEYMISELIMLTTVNPGCDHVVVAPTYDQCREVLLPRFLARMAEMSENGYPLLKKSNWSILRFDLHCGGRVFFRSMDKVANLRGFEFATLTGDEFDFAKNPMDAWDTLSGRVRQSHATCRQATIATTPYTYSDSIIELFAVQRAKAAKIEDPIKRNLALRTWYFQRASTLENPTLPRDYLATLLSYSKSQYIREVLGYPQVHRAARVYPTFGEVHIIDELPNGRPLFDKRLPYDIGIDWGHHRPSYVFVQRHGNMAVVFLERHPEDEPPEHQLAALKKLCDTIGRAPENVAVDRADTDQIAALKKLWRGTRIVSAQSKGEQSRVGSVEAIQRLLDPYEGQPRLYVSRALTEANRSKRGVFESLQNLEWEYDRTNNRFLDKPKKDGTFDHAHDALSYWAKLIGVDAMKPYEVRQIIY